MPVFAREREFDELVYAEARRRGLDPVLIKAVIATESSFNPAAYRAEPAIRDGSHGLMQILYATAKMMGYTGTPEGLFDPEINIRFGSAYLTHQLTRYGGDVPSALSAYNAGTAFRKPDGTFTNQPYVDRALGYYRELQAREVPPAGPAPPPAAAPPVAGGTVLGLLVAAALLGLLLLRLR